MNKEYKKLCPFKGWALENFPFIEADFDAITNYELLCKIVEYLNKTSSQFNDMIDNINYLNNWFDNLDLQEEVNNKLDAMVEDGTLQEIVANYLNSKAIFAFNTVADMKEATNFINGSFAETLGYYNKNDGGASLYKIRKITNDDIVDNAFIIELQDNQLIAELIYNEEINLEKIGAKINDNTYDCYNVYELAISKGIKTIKLLTGNYYFSRLVLHDGINIIGNGFNNTRLNALISEYNYFICLDKGPVINCNIKDFRIVGNSNNNNQIGLYIYALPPTTGYQHGGLWNSLLENLYIENFTKNQIYIEGYNASLPYKLPNQFNIFNNIYACGNANSEDVVIIKPQFAQAIFNNCTFEKATGNYYNLKIDGNCDIIFNSLTSQSSNNGIYLKGGNIQFNKIWLENIANCCVYCENISTDSGGNYNFVNGSFKNCAYETDTKAFHIDSRTIIKAENISFINSGIKTMIEVSQLNSTTFVDFSDCYYSIEPEQFYSRPYNYIQSDANGNVNFNTNRINRIDASGSSDNTITNITFQGWVKGCNIFNCFSHTSITFSGNNFVNPQTIPANKNFVIVRLNPYQTQENNNFNKLLIIYQ